MKQSDIDKAITKVIAAKFPEKFGMRNSTGAAHKEENYYPNEIRAMNITYELAEARIYRNNSWATYERKLLSIKIED